MKFSNTNYGSSIMVVVCFLFLLILPFETILEAFDLDEFKREYLGDSIKNIVIIIFGYVLIKHFGYTKISGVTKLFHRHIFLFLLPTYFVLFGPLQYILMSFEFHDVKIMNVIILFISMITVGISEEIIFRGFVLPNLIKGASPGQALIIPMFISSLMFGVLHFLNLFQSDSNFYLALSQVIYATVFGVAFSIILLRTGSLLPLGFIHGIINFSSNFDDLPGTYEPINPETYITEQAIISLLVVLPLLFITLRQISKIDRNTIMRLYQ